MKLYTRAMLGVIAAFVLTYVVLGIAKSLVMDPSRRATLRQANQPGLDMAADTIQSAPDAEAALAALQPHFGDRLSLTTLGRAEASGWYRDGDKMFAFRDVGGDRDLVYGPFPTIDPHQTLQVALAFGAPLFFAVLVAFVVVTPVIRRVRALERITRRLASGELSARADDSGGDAVASLAERINTMAEEIERLLENKKELLQAVSHEFRTPTSRIRFALEMLEEEDPEARAAHLAGIDESLVEMDELVDELLTYVRFEGRAPELSLSPLNPFKLAEKLATELEPLRESVEVVVRGDESATINANPRYLRRALLNLVLNAIRHAESQVMVEIGSGAEATTISVTDDGPGIGKADRKKVFEPFVRLEASRSRESGGAGLGLAIVKRICEWHDARIEVADSESGARLVVTWPSGSP